MNNKGKETLDKAKLVKEHGVSRINQLKQEMAEQQPHYIAEIQDAPELDRFIEEDLEESLPPEKRKLVSNPKVKNKPSAKLITDNSTTEETLDQLRIREQKDLESKVLLDSLLKDTIPVKPDVSKIDPQSRFKKKNFENAFYSRNAPSPQPKQQSLYESSLYSKISQGTKSLPNIPSKSLSFFLLDATECPENMSVIYLFGKSEIEGKFIDTCVQVTDLRREIYIMPRRGISVADVEIEIRGLLSGSRGLTKADIKYEKVIKKYCFEMDVDYRNEEVEVLCVSYSFKQTAISNLSQYGKTYKGVFGISTPPLELFILNSQIEGPNWMSINNFKVDATNSFSDQPLCITLSDCKGNVKVTDRMRQAPPLSLLTFQMQVSDSSNEVEAIHLSAYSQFNISSGTNSAVSHFFLYQQGVNEGETGKQVGNCEFLSHKYNSEYSLLVATQILVSKTNPDIIVGHELLGGLLEIYLSKLLKNGIDSLHLLNRRNIEPHKLKGPAVRKLNTKTRLLFTGRLILDTFALSKEFVKLDEYSLTSVISHISNESVPSKFQTVGAELRAGSQMIEGVLAGLNLLPLTLQLSKVAGCLWQVSLRQARAERNEVLLLRRFKEANYLLPDKQRNYEQDTASGEKGFEGGLVLEPQAGLYDNYIILVDFNSLYPSIIRHFKICFTTVQRPLRPIERAEEEINEIKEDQEVLKPLNDIVCNEKSDPLLPGILSVLISRRREVKAQLRKEKNPSVIAQLEIRQQAYKLVANSIYGCLGFVSSRFYSKRIAAIITHFGRDLLRKSENLIKDKGHVVIYGDTDSLMVNTFKTDLSEAILCGLTLKKEINEQFKKDRSSREQILEVELDGVFKKLLLLKKKKYTGIAVTNFMQIAKAQGEPVAEQTRLEVKGLDMIRRDWSQITKNVCKEVISILMTNGDLEQVYTHLGKVNENLDIIEKTKDHSSYVATSEHPIAISDFVIKKQLNKKLGDYGDSNLLPQVKVGYWMKKYFNKTDEQLVGHFIPYVVTTRGNFLGDKAMHIQEYMSQFHQTADNSTIHPLDIAWYKNAQVINPINRILDPIEGHSSNRLLLIFELKVAEQSSGDDHRYQLLDEVAKVQAAMPCVYRSSIQLEEFSVSCPFCSNNCYAFLARCPNKVDGVYSESVFSFRVSTVLCRIAQEFYTMNRKCPECDYSVNSFSVYPLKCPIHESKKLKPAMTPQQATEKILYFQQLCDIGDGESRINRLNTKKLLAEVFHPIVSKLGYEYNNLLVKFNNHRLKINFKKMFYPFLISNFESFEHVLL